jgi:TonB family protein
MFAESITPSWGKRGWRNLWLLFPASLLLHCLLIAALIIGPLIRADEAAPTMKKLVVSAWLTVPPLPGPPRGGNAGNRPLRHSRRPATTRSAPTAASTRFVAPATPPAQIANDISLPPAIGEGEEGPGVPGAPEDGDMTAIIPDSSVPEMQKNYRPIFVKQPKLIKRVVPEYPETARKIHLSGEVIITAITDKFGRVSEAHVISGHPLLQDAALAAVREWLFEPYLINGVPQPVTFVVKVGFSLQMQ